MFIEIYMYRTRTNTDEDTHVRADTYANAHGRHVGKHILYVYTYVCMFKYIACVYAHTIS